MFTLPCRSLSIDIYAATAPRLPPPRDAAMRGAAAHTRAAAELRRYYVSSRIRADASADAMIFTLT